MSPERVEAGGLVNIAAAVQVTRSAATVQTYFTYVCTHHAQLSTTHKAWNRVLYGAAYGTTCMARA